MESIKVMTFNLRVDNTGDGINSFTNRRGRVADMLVRTSPDLIGFQECTGAMRASLEQSLTDYRFVGCGRERDYTGESMAIAFKTAEFSLISEENFWLTATPCVPGSTLGGDQSPCPRMATVAVLYHKRTAKQLCFCNTHLDHQGAIARRIEAALLCARLERYSQPIILTGDMNATPDAPEIGILRNAMQARGAADVTASLGGTFHNFGRIAPENCAKIDYIYTSCPCRACSIVPDDMEGKGLFYSDHFVILAELE